MFGGSTTTFGSDVFDGGIASSADGLASEFSSPGTPVQKPTAPPRRSRSKKGSESDSSQPASKSGPTSGMMGEGAVGTSQPSPMKAPPRRSRSKQGSVSESRASVPPALPKDGSDMFDFGADFSGAFSDEGMQSMSAKPSDSSSGIADAFMDGFSQASRQAESGGQTSGEKAGSNVDMFGFGESFVDPFPAEDLPQGALDDPFPPVSVSSQSLNVDFSDAFPAPSPALNPGSIEALGAMPQSSEADTLSSFQADKTLTTDNTATGLEVNLFAPKAETTASNNSLFDLDFGSLMSASAPALVNKPLENVKTEGRGSPINRDSPVMASFYLSDSSMSASSSAAELSALTEMGTAASMQPTDPFSGLLSGEATPSAALSAVDSTSMNITDPLAGKTDLFGGLPSCQSAVDSLSFPADSANRATPTSLSSIGEGFSEPADLPPPSPAMTSSLAGGLGMEMLSAFEQAEASAELEEVLILVILVLNFIKLHI